MRRFAILAALAVSAAALAHTMGGVVRLFPGSDFTFLAMKAVLPGQGPGVVEFSPLRGSALAFLILDPGLPADVAEAHRFEKLAARLPHTRAFLVALPQRSQNPRWLAETAARNHFRLPLLVDDRDVFPFSFGLALNQSPRYQLFDRNWTLVIENGANLDQRLQTGLSIGRVLEELDAGRPVEPAELPAKGEARGPAAASRRWPAPPRP